MGGKAGRRGFLEGIQELRASIVSERELEIRQKGLGKGHKGGMGRGRLFNIPFRSFAGEHALEQTKTDGVIGNGIGGTPHVERSDIIGWIFAIKALKLRDVGGELGWHSRPISIVVNGVIDQLMEIREAKACNVWQHKGGWGSSCGGSASSRVGIRAGRTASVRPWTRHSEGDRGRTRSKRRTQ